MESGVLGNYAVFMVKGVGEMLQAMNYICCVYSRCSCVESGNELHLLCVFQV